MEQMMVFWTKYANEISGALLLLVLILVLVTLHRIKKLGIQIRKLTEDTFVSEAETEVEEDEILQANADGTTAARVDDTPEELLDAVLGEVFS